MNSASSFSFYIGTNASGGRPCLYRCEADFGRGTFSTTHAVSAPEKPSYLAASADGHILYTLGRPCGTSGAVYAFRVTENAAGGPEGCRTGEASASTPLTPLGLFPCGGDNPCHISLDPQGAFLLCANYGSGSVSLYDLCADGSIHSMCDCRQYAGTGFDAADRQKGPHAHFAAFHPGRDEVLVCDLGLDMVYVYALDREAGKLRDTGRSFRLPAGTGPRHLAFCDRHPDLVYVITEMANLVFVFRYDPDADRYLQAQVISPVPEIPVDPAAFPAASAAKTPAASPVSSAAEAPAAFPPLSGAEHHPVSTSVSVPAGSDTGICPPRPDLMVPSTADNGSIGCAIRFSADGNYLFVSSRLGYQSISAFRCRPDGLLTFCSRSLCGGITPRDFHVFSTAGAKDAGPDAGGRVEEGTCDYLLAANQDSDMITALRFDRNTETLSLLDLRMSVEHPTCILPIPPAPQDASAKSVLSPGSPQDASAKSSVSPVSPQDSPAKSALSPVPPQDTPAAADIYGGERDRMEQVLRMLLDRVEDLRRRYRSADNDPVEHCRGRIKSDESMREKCRRNDLPETTASALEELHDAIGIRIVCAFLNDVYMMRDFIVGFDDVELVLEKDYIRRAKPNGYRSLHLILRVSAGDGRRDGEPAGVHSRPAGAACTDSPGQSRGSGYSSYYVEVQLRTISMDTWAALEHHMKYKKQLSGNTGLLESELKRCADELASTDVSMQTLRDMIRGS